MGSTNPFFGLKHSAATVERIQLAKSAGTVYLYSALGLPIASFTSAKALYTSIGSTHTGVMNAIQNHTLFRGLCYISMLPFAEGMELPTNVEVEAFIKLLQESPVQNKVVFVFTENGEYLRSYAGVLDCARSMHMSHNRITESIKNGTVYNNYVFSAHRISVDERPFKNGTKN